MLQRVKRGPSLHKSLYTQECQECSVLKTKQRGGIKSTTKSSDALYKRVKSTSTILPRLSSIKSGKNTAGTIVPSTTSAPITKSVQTLFDLHQTSTARGKYQVSLAECFLPLLTYSTNKICSSLLAFLLADSGSSDDNDTDNDNNDNNDVKHRWWRQRRGQQGRRQRLRSSQDHQWQQRRQHHASEAEREET